MKIMVFAGGLLTGLLLAGLAFVLWQIHQRPPSLFHYYPAPEFRAPLVISLFNATKQPIAAAIVLDDETLMTGMLPGRTPISFPDDFAATAAFSPTLGKHELSVVVGDVGKIAMKEIVQETNQTKLVEIFIKSATTGTNRLDCDILVHTNILGVM